jgi:hypothetical protein
MRKLITRFLHLLILLILLTSCSSFHSMSDNKPIVITQSSQGLEFTVNIEIGNKIVIAIEQYKVDKGYYPSSLSDLLPKYLSEIPKTYSGDDFRYNKLVPSSLMNWDPYLVSFDLTNAKNVGCAYSRFYKKWECGPKNPQ